MRTHWHTRSGIPVAHLGVPRGLAPTTNNKMKRKGEVNEAPWARAGVTDALLQQLESRMRELEASTNLRTKAEAGRQHAQEDGRQRRTASEHPRQPSPSTSLTQCRIESSSKEQVWRTWTSQRQRSSQLPDRCRSSPCRRQKRP